MSSTVARDVLWPTDPKVLARVCFLYVGQGSSIVVIVRDGGTQRALLVDSNLDKRFGGIDVAALMKDLLGDEKLYAFVNTHPHDDHLKGVSEVAKAVSIERVWHTGFDPGKRSGNHYKELQDLIEDVKKRNGADAIVLLEGSRTSRPLLDAEVFVLAPAEHVSRDIDEQDADARYARIHEQCGVLRFGKGDSWILVTGDADLDAFKNHITEYHKERLPSFVLDASHHGSRSFFKGDKDAEPYLDGLKAINPTYVVMSAPTSTESPHEHPHEDAVKLYVDHLGNESNVLLTGKERETFFFDIRDDGTTSGPQSDKGRLTEVYGLDKKDDGGGGGGSNGGGGGGSKKAQDGGPFVRPSAPSVPTPKKYARPRP